MKTKKKCKRDTFFPKFFPGEDQKKNEKKRKRSSSNIEHLFPPNSGEDPPKKRSSSKIKHFFPQFSLRCTPIQIIGGDTAKLLGGYIPPSPPCFGTPGYRTGLLTRCKIVSKRGSLVLNLQKPTAAKALQVCSLSAFAFETITLRNFENKIV